MDIKACDNCGVQSPDREGLHFANNWVSIHANNPGILSNQTSTKYLIVCLNCWEVMRKAMIGSPP